MHIHSSASDDGDRSIREIIDLAALTHDTEKPVTLVAVTDHEEIDFEGLTTSMSYARKNYIDLVTGLEVSAEDSTFDFEKVHILNYFPYLKPNELRKTGVYEIMNDMKEEKRIRNDKYIRMLLSYGFLKQHEVEDVDFGRSKATLAQKLFEILQKKGRFRFAGILYEITEIEQVWDILEDRMFRQDREKVSAETIIYETIIAGGRPVIAHPLLMTSKHSRECILGRAAQEYVKTRKVADTILNYIRFLNYYHERFPELGLEIRYPYEKSREYKKIISENRDAGEVLGRMVEGIEAFCRDNRIAISGGSDYHGSAKPDIEIGQEKIMFEDATDMLNIT